MFNNSIGYGQHPRSMPRRELVPPNNGCRRENLYEITEAIFYKISISKLKMFSMNGYTFIVD